MSRGRWFLPETPTCSGSCAAQVAVTIEGVDAFAAWAAATTAAEMVRDAEHRGDAAKRALLGALRAAFVTPLEPEDVFALSRGIDWILVTHGTGFRIARRWHARRTPVIAEMARLLGEAVGDIDQALAHLGTTTTRRPRPPTRRSRPSASSSARTTGWRAARGRGQQRTDRPPRAVPPLSQDRRGR